MPGVSGLGISTMSILTGMRWVILVKLPDGLGVGSSAKRAVVALPMRATRPTKRVVGIGIDRDMHLLAELQPADLGLLDVGLDPDLVGIVQQQDALAGLHVLARQHEGAVDHGRHRAADRAVLDVDVLLVHLRREIGDLMVERGDLRVDHAQLVVLDPGLLEAALGLLVLGARLQDLAFELVHGGLRHLELRARWPRGARTATSCARARASPGRGRT